jgi:hypothetical protein
MRRARNDGAGSGAGAAALAAGYEHHVGALERLLYIRLMILRRLRALLGVGSGAEASAGSVIKRDLHIRIGSQQILCIGIDRYEFNVLQTFGNHAIDGIAAGSTDTDYLNIGLVVEIVSLGNLAHHSLLSFTVMPYSSAESGRIGIFSRVYPSFFHFRLRERHAVTSQTKSDAQ